MKILVIGGTRFIGRHLAPELLAAGHQVTLLNRGSNPEAAALGVTHIVGDRNDPTVLLNVLAADEYDAVVDMILSDASQAAHIVQACSNRIGHYIMLSTRSVYAADVGSPILETDALEERPEMAYGYNKASAEQVLLSAFQDSGFPATILRLPAIYGEYDYQIRERYFIRRLLEKRPHILLPDGGAGVNQREYAGNIAAQVAFLLSKPSSKGQVYNAGHHKTQNYRAIVEDAIAIAGHPMAIYSIPALLHPAIPDLAWSIVNIQSTAKLEALGWVEKFSPYQALERTIAWQSTCAIDEYLPTHRCQRQHFDYLREDALLAALGVKIK